MTTKATDVQTYIAEVPAEQDRGDEKLRSLCRQQFVGYEECNGVRYAVSPVLLSHHLRGLNSIYSRKTQPNDENDTAQMSSLFAIHYHSPTIFPAPSTTYRLTTLDTRQTRATLIP